MLNFKYNITSLRTRLWIFICNFNVDIFLQKIKHRTNRSSEYYYLNIFHDRGFPEIGKSGATRSPVDSSNNLNSNNNNKNSNKRCCVKVLTSLLR